MRNERINEDFIDRVANWPVEFTQRVHFSSGIVLDEILRKNRAPFEDLTSSVSIDKLSRFSFMAVYLEKSSQFVLCFEYKNI